MKEQLLRLRSDLGRSGLLALLLLALAFSFHAFVVKPLQAKNAGMQATLARQGPGPAAPAGQKLAQFYQALGHPETATDWLAKLYAISKATGVEMQSANYKSESADKAGSGAGRIERYEIVLPVAGTYSQLRDFLGRALAEIPVLSLDQMSLRRESRTEGEVQAELRLTLHLVKP